MQHESVCSVAIFRWAKLSSFYLIARSFGSGSTCSICGTWALCSIEWIHIFCNFNKKCKQYSGYLWQDTEPQLPTTLIFIKFTCTLTLKVCCYHRPAPRGCLCHTQIIQIKRVSWIVASAYKIHQSLHWKQIHYPCTNMQRYSKFVPCWDTCLRWPLADCPSWKHITRGNRMWWQWMTVSIVCVLAFSII